MQIRSCFLMLTRCCCRRGLPRTCSAVAWSPENNLMIANGRLAVQEYQKDRSDRTPVRKWSESETWIYRFYDCIIAPAWTVLPKPSRLDDFVPYAMTRGNAATENGDGDTGGPFRHSRQRQRVASFDPVPVLRDNIIFIMLLLIFSCAYISRHDF